MGKKTETKENIETIPGDKESTENKTIKASGFAGLPIDESIDSWMDEDMGGIDSDDEGESDNMKVVDNTKHNNMAEEKAPSKGNGFAGLPIDNSVDDWMNDDMGTMESDNEGDSGNIEDVTNTKQNNIVKETTSMAEEKAPTKGSGFAGLPIDESVDDWMNDDMGTMESDNEGDSGNIEDVTNTKQNNIVKETTSIAEEKAPTKASGFAGLPIDE